MNARNSVQLKSNVKDIYWAFIRAENHVILPCSITLLLLSQAAITCSKLTIETLELGVKYV